MNEFYERIAKLSPKRLSLLAIDLQSRINELQAKTLGTREPIAVVGMGCRFPGGGDDPVKFWRLLCEGRDCIGEVPADRWNVNEYYDPDPKTPGKMCTRFGGFLASVNMFDAGFFGISPREAREMDPQQRLVLEVTWETLENAGIPPESLRGSATGVYFGISNSDHLQILMAGDPLDIGIYSAVGNAHSVAAGRVSYILGLQGPAYAIDTACSSSLAAVHLACKSLLLGECRLALAGGVNLLLSPEATVMLSKLQMLAPDGRCKAFDAAADGFVRGEGCGVVALKRLSHAREDGNRVLALIRGSAVNQDGRSNGLTAPNGPAQESVLRAALKDAFIDASRIGYVECHGTGTALGDPIEVQALAAVLGAGRGRHTPLMIGTVKPNIGHLEAAAGIAGLIKAVLCLQHGELPSSLHFRDPNPYIPWQDLAVDVVTTKTPWISEQSPRFAGVSSFGFSGTNVHIIVEEAPTSMPPANRLERPRHPFCLSANSRGALEAQVERATEALAAFKDNGTPAAVADIAYSANAGRAHHPFRFYTTAATPGELTEHLQEFTRAEVPSEGMTGELQVDDAPRIAFLFTGQGAQYANMGRELYETQPVFRGELDRCAEVLAPLLEVPLLEVIHSAQGPGDLLNQTAYTQPALFAVEYALMRLWEAWGIRPAAVMGHSVGEYTAACAAGVFSLEDGLRLMTERGRLIQSLPQDGAMAAVFEGMSRIEPMLAACGPSLSVAAVNGPANTVISGPKVELAALLDALADHGIAHRCLTVSHAFHSALMDPVLEPFEKAAAAVSYRPPQVDIVSNLTGRVANDDMTHPAYWRRHMRSPVRFGQGMQTLRDMQVDIFVEIGPHPVLLGMGRLCLGPDFGTWLPSLRRGRSDWQQMLETIGRLYLKGITPDWKSFDAPYRRQLLDLPTYPFERTRYPLKTLSHRESVPAGLYLSGGRHTLVGPCVHTARNEYIFTTVIGRKGMPFLDEHRVFGRMLAPARVFIEMVRNAADQTPWQGAHCIRDLVIEEALAVPEDEAVEVQLIFSRPSDSEVDFEIFSRQKSSASKDGTWRLHVSGKIGRAEPPAQRRPAAPLSGLKKAAAEYLDGQVYYDALGRHGLQFGPSFRGIGELWRAEGQALARLIVPEGLSPSSGDHRLYSSRLDAALQTLGAVLPMGDDSIACLAVGFEKFTIEGDPGLTRWALAELRPGERSGPDNLLGQVRLLGESGEHLGSIDGIRLQRVRPENPPPFAKRFKDWLYEWVWQAQPSNDTAAPSEETAAGAALAGPAQTAAPGKGRLWMIFGDGGGFAAHLAARVRALGDDAQRVSAGRQLRKLDDCTWEIPPFSTDDYDRLFNEAVEFDRFADIRIVHLAALDAAPAAGMTPAGLEADAERSCRSLLLLVQALARVGPKRNLRLWVATAGAPAAAGVHASLSQAALWGLGRTVAQEHPEFWGGLVDLEGSDLEEQIPALLSVMTSSDGEDQVLLRGRRRYAGRLKRHQLGGTHTGSMRFSGEHTYLVTGGLGGMGRKLVEWMIRRGAKNLLLIGRSAADQNALAWIEGLSEQGIRVEAQAADVSREEDVRRVFAKLQSSLPPLKGVFHLAGVFEDRVLIRHSWDRFQRVFAPKISGAWLLHEFTKDLPLDLFVLFSSAASFLAPVGLGNYAAANAFLDALAHYRHGLGLPALSVDWGPWGKVGMAEAVGDMRERQWEQAGFSLMTADHALLVLAHLLESQAVQVAVLDTNWTRYLERFGADSRPKMFADLQEEDAAHGNEIPPPAEAVPLLGRLQSMQPAERAEVLLNEILKHMREVLELNQFSNLEPATGFFDLGMDSLTAIELKNRLQASMGMTLSPTIVFDYPSAKALNAHLLKELFASQVCEQAPVPSAVPVVESAEAESVLQDLTEDELALRLFEKLKQLE
jgi:acyl transferase domain-containing protein/acyl carrier protein